MLLRGCTKDGVYEWPTSSPSIAFSIIKTTSFDWHHRLGHPIFPILKHIVSNNHFVLSSSLSHNFTCNAYLYNKNHKLSFFPILQLSLHNPLTSYFRIFGPLQFYQPITLNTMLSSLIISLNTSSCIHLNKNPNSMKSLLDSKLLQKIILIHPLKFFILTIVKSILPLGISFHPLVSHI